MVFRQTVIRLSEKSKSKSSSWAARQFRDPYVKKRLSDPMAYRARSAFKLLEINDDSNKFLEYPDVKAVVDLGAAPGGWSQVVADKLGWNRTPPGLMPLSRNPTIPRDPHPMEKAAKSKKWGRSKPTPPVELDYFDPLNIDNLDEKTGDVTGRGTIVSVDLLKIESIPGVQTLQANFLHQSTTVTIKNILRNEDNPEGKVDVVLSDMAANVSGNDTHDIEECLEICEAVFAFAQGHLRTAESTGRRRGGVLLMKFFAHPLLEKFRDEKLKPNFNHVSYIKPSSSRTTSREGYYLCQGWRPLQS